MRRLTLASALGCALALAVLPAALAAQEHGAADTATATQALPHDVVRAVVDAYNGPAALRASGRIEIGADREIDGNVAVLSGPVYIAGHVTGSVTAVNADVILRPTARIDGDVLVVGGTITGRDSAYIGGEIQAYRQVLHYHQDDDHIVADRETAPEDERWWHRWERHPRRTTSKLTLATLGTYNRVEGLPIYLGPSLRQLEPWGSVSLKAYGVIRSADHFSWESQNFGHRVDGELRVGRDAGVAVGGRLYDVIAPVEDWQLTDLEVALASFFFHRDYRDYYERHGGAAYATLYAARDVSLTAALSEERWGARAERDPFSLFHNGAVWRPNPQLDDMLLHRADAQLLVDTRNDVDDPWSGWYVLGDIERGVGTVAFTGPTSPGVASIGTGNRSYVRGFLDLRRYNRVTPDAQINFRVVLGGWLGGDPLPLERRFSVGGPGSIPGFDFRSRAGTVDVGTCSTTTGTPDGVPAQCERMALAQVEYRGDLHIGIFGTDLDIDRDDGGDHDGWHTDATWVAFADAGRGWLLGAPGDGLHYRTNAVPSFGTFRTDLGIGLDFDVLGVYVAKAMSTNEPANLVVRVRHRF